MSNTMPDPQEPQPESVVVPVPGPKRIRRAARSVKRGTIAFATHPFTTATVKGVGRGAGVVGIAVVSATAHGLALGYAQNNLANGFRNTSPAPAQKVAPVKAVKVA